MMSSELKHQRRSIRLKDYDYSQNGAYFLTVCVQQRESLFGDVESDTVHLNDAGQVIDKWWREIEKKFPEVEIDDYVIMPNHFHGIVLIVGADLCVCPDEIPKEGAHAGAPLQNHPSIGQIVQWFKTMTTNEYMRGVKESGWQPFQGRLWQRNYYESVIRNESALNDIRSYIQTNPACWAQDAENPANAFLEIRS